MPVFYRLRNSYARQKHSRDRLPSEKEKLIAQVEAVLERWEDKKIDEIC